jgi:RNA polymerase sigma-70 factor (ECF subfamily)
LNPFPNPGPGGSFPETRASVVADAGSEDPQVRERALAWLVRSYWSPAYKYLRLRGHLPREEAEDLTQGFFASLLERGLVARYSPERGRFRTYLRVCLDGYSANERKAAGRHKRGGGFPHVPLDFETAEGEIRELPLADDADPDELFHREWVRGLFSRAVDALRAECESTDRPMRFALFRRYDLEAPEAGETLTYADLAREYDIEGTRVTNELHAARQRFRTLVLEEIRAVTATEAEFREEARALLGTDTA